MNVRLIAPGSTDRPMDSAWKKQMSAPLALAILGALTPEKHRVSVEDENVAPIRLGTDVDLVGITVKVDTVERARRISAYYRKRGTSVVWGGIYPTMCPEHCAQFADSVVVGDAENLWPRLLDDFEGGRLRRVYRNTFPVDMRDVPMPRWDLLRKGRYLFTNTLRIGRGCPWRCDFCYNSSPNIASRYRTKPIAHVLRDIESLGTRHVMFIDDNFIGDPAYARMLIERFRNMGLTWHAAVSADIGRHKDILDAMAETGCKSLFIGFESTNQRNIKSCGKKQNLVESYNRTIKAIHDRCMMVNASLVFGFDNDDETVFASTMDWLVCNKVETMTAHILTPYPGTVLHDRLLREGRIIDTDLTNYNTSRVVFQPAGMSVLQLNRGYRWMYSEFYSFRNIMKRRPDACSQLIAYLEFNLLYRKFGRATCLLGKMFGMRNLARLATVLAYRPDHEKKVSGRKRVDKGAPLLIGYDKG